MSDHSIPFNNHKNTVPSTTDLTPGQYLREKRLQRGYSIRKLAEEANCSASYLNRIEHGQRRLDSMANIILLASILDFPVSELLQLTSLSDAEMLSPIRTAFPSIQTSHQETVITKFASLITSGALSDEQMDQLIFNATAFKEYCQKCNQHK